MTESEKAVVLTVVRRCVNRIRETKDGGYDLAGDDVSSWLYFLADWIKMGTNDSLRGAVGGAGQNRTDD